ncbi:hypothetical protein ACFJGX_11795 [Hydrogenophaga sp. UC242_50]
MNSSVLPPGMRVRRRTVRGGDWLTRPMPVCLFQQVPYILFFDSTE